MTSFKCPECGATFVVPGESDLKWYQNKEIVDKVNETEKSTEPVSEVKEKEPKRKIYYIMNCELFDEYII